MAKKKKYEVGDVIGDLKIIYDFGNAENGHHYYKCKCLKCGRTEIVQTFRLNKEHPACRFCMNYVNDYRDKIVDGYKIIDETDKRSSSRNLIWNCRCMSCGKVIEVTSNRICRGDMPKCSCDRYRKAPSRSFIAQLF